MSRLSLALLFFFVAFGAGCSVDADCGSGDDSAPGRCVGGICQCGVGYEGNTPLDPSACSLVCAPPALPDAVAFLREPNVTVGAAAGAMTLQVALAPHLKQTPSSVALLHPATGASCALLPQELGLARWSQTVDDDAAQCHLRYDYAAPFADAVGQTCWQTLPQTTESGAQYSITFNQYATQVEVVQQGLAPFGQSAAKRDERDDVLITRAFRRNYTVSVATQFKPNSAPFALLAEPPVGPTAIDDAASAPQNTPVVVAVMANDLPGYQNVDGSPVPHTLMAASLTITSAPSHGSLTLNEGQVAYTPSALYHGPDAFEYRICDSASLCDSANVSITVTPVPPVANDDGAQCGHEASVEVDVLANDVAGAGAIETLTLVGGDGAANAVVTEDREVLYTAPAGFSGQVTVVYEICDASNPTVLCDQASVLIEVDGRAPVAVDDTISTPQNTPVAFNLTLNDLPGTEPLDHASVTLLSGPSHGSIAGNTYTPNNLYHGPDAMEYRVCDLASPPKCATANVSITVTPVPPVANDDGAQCDHESSVEVDVLANDVLGAGPIASVAIVVAPGNGHSATVTESNGILFNAAADFSGLATLVYEICDASNPTALCDQATLTIDVDGTGPLAVNDALSTPQNTPASVNVSANDLAGTEPLIIGSVSILSGPSHGSVSGIADGVISYAPAAGYHGADQLTYQICDLAVPPKCASANVSITVVPQPPVANNDGAQCGHESSVVIDALANDVAGALPIASLTIISVSPRGGSASVTGDNQVQFDAAASFAGLVSITYEICDASNPTALCDQAVITVDVDGRGPLAVNDAISTPQNTPTSVNVSANDLAGTEPLDVGSVSIVTAPSHGSVTGIADGVISYSPSAGYHGDDQITYQICDLAVPPKCASANVSITVTPNGPTANDDSTSMGYGSGSLNVDVLANDVAGAQPLDTSSVSVSSPPSSGSASVQPDGSIAYTPNAGFVGSDSFVYEVCDSSLPTPLCDTATVTVVVNPRDGAAIQYRLVTIDYDILGNAIAATVQTRVPDSAKVGNVALNATESSGLSPVVGGPTSTATCDAGSPAGFCDQFHEVRFSDEPCLVSGAELALDAAFLCADGSAPSACGYENVKALFLLDQLLLDYDACPRVVEYGIDAATSFLRLHEDEPRAVPVSVPAQQGSTLYGRCSLLPSAGATFQSVTLSALKVFDQNGGSPLDLGNQLSASFMTMLSPLTSTSPTNPIWDFNLQMEPTFFLLANTYYLEATLELTFANTGPLTRRLEIPLGNPASGAKRSMLRSALSNPNVVHLVAVDSNAQRAPRDQEEGIFSNTFAVRAAAGSEAEQLPAGEASSDNTGMVAGIAGAVVGAAMLAIGIVLVGVIRRRRRSARERSASDAPLKAVSIDDLDIA